MSETLSQDEVDALREAVASGAALEEPEPEATAVKKGSVKVVAYNFRKPHLLSADQRHAIEATQDSLARNLQVRLNTLLRRPLEIKLVALDQIAYGEFELSLANPTYLARLDTEPDGGSVALEMGVGLVAAMIEILLGGSKTLSERTALSPLDMDLFTPVLDAICDQMSLDWSGLAPVAFRLARNETRPEYLQLTTPETSCMNATFDIRLGEVSGVLSLCMPIGFIHAMFAAQERRIGRQDQTQTKERMLKALALVPLGLRVALGSGALSARQVSQLKPGDVVLLDREYDEPVNVLMGSEPVFSAHIGKRRGRLAVQLLDRPQSFAPDSESGAGGRAAPAAGK